jgi:hypothetical protein
MKTMIISILSFSLLSCSFTNKTKISTEDEKGRHIRMILQQTGFIKLPLIFDANNENALKETYRIDRKCLDSIIFDDDMFDIVGFLPDTSLYFAILFNTVGDMLYPTIITIDKAGRKIDRQIISTTACAGNVAVDVISCYDSVWILNDLQVFSRSKVVGTVETEDSIPQVLKICNSENLTGSIARTGKIRISRSKKIDCN